MSTTARDAAIRSAVASARRDAVQLRAAKSKPRFTPLQLTTALQRLQRESAARKALQLKSAPLSESEQDTFTFLLRAGIAAEKATAIVIAKRSAQ